MCVPVGVQALAASLAASEAIPGRANAGCMLLFKQAVLHSTLGAADAAALYLFASNTIIPVVRAANKTTRTLQKLYSSVADWTKPTGAALDAASWHVAKGREQDGLLTYGGGTDGAKLGACALVHIARQRPCRLVAWQLHGFLVRCLCESCSNGTARILARNHRCNRTALCARLFCGAHVATKMSLLENSSTLRLDVLAAQVLVLVDGEGPIPAAELPCARHLFVTCIRDLDRTYAATLPAAKRGAHDFVTRVTELVRAKDKGHVAGHRYSLVDTAAGVPLASATPASKLAAATSLSAQALVGQLWCDAQQQMAAERRRCSAKYAQCAVQGVDASSSAAAAPEAVAGQRRQEESAEGNDATHASEAAAAEHGGAAPESGAGRADDAAPEKQRRADDAGADAADASDPAREADATAAPAAPDASGSEAPAEAVRGGDGAAEHWRHPHGQARMEIVAQTPSKKWVVAKWALANELLHIDDSVARDSAALAAAGKNAMSMVDSHYPGALGL